ncbi:tripartite tricarboxylate transporter substrate binding protein [Ottowia sp. GY511]|uniref:Bug family tripartite tricarboxylate transporter substrate binding protein n=1 Tax=Ottowia flava TaxID=2675430 RepID=A0ABW4KSQ9_9BURK|nr:tripartite tricarboxylate transporter substrate binding protein [Ottowia sp. GY511]TXK33351.1 tripartite tricarboxylate transporter substrate binding protein [Ottowia sp. GY511]
MFTASRRTTLALMGTCLLVSTSAFAADTAAWPSKPIHFITPYPPGGSSDIITRFIGDRVSKALGQPVIVENKPGAGAMLGTEYASRQAPDGYSFFVGPTATVAVAPYIRKTTYTWENFVPVAKLSSSYGLISARKDAPFNNYKEFVAAAKANPNKFTFASNGVGSIVHLTGVLLHKQTGIQVTHVPYKGAVESMTDMMGGRIDVMYDPVPAPRVKAGELKGLATTSDQRNPDLPNIPTLKEQGFEVSAPSWFGLFAPKGTPDAIVARMAAEAQKVLAQPGVREQLQLSAMYPDYEGPAEFAKRVRRDANYLKDVIQKEGIKAE